MRRQPPSEPQQISGVVTEQDEIIRALEDLTARFERGEVTSASLRVYKKDGTFQDVALGETEKEKAQALDALHQMLKQGH